MTLRAHLGQRPGQRLDVVRADLAPEHGAETARAAAAWPAAQRAMNGRDHVHLGECRQVGLLDLVPERLEELGRVAGRLDHHGLRRRPRRRAP